ncbi:hypothetical protein EVAR_41763_1 [Eumeta japonica]|uniref:Pre-C2HC domain-containing protein n=1 Tax=Eumeta variegata TaxID=151549 RepID=A0A4C1W1C6_EUMVA|nr:hypothetical protein EVAR_41763_1 [Eumeta japonica]
MPVIQQGASKFNWRSSRTSEIYPPFSQHLKSYITYSLKEEREFRVVLRGVPKLLPIEELKEDLLAQDLSVQSVRRITDHAREAQDLVLVTSNTIATDNATKHSFFNIKVRARCVKCLGDHGSAACTRNKETDGPPAYVLCKSSGHMANYLALRIPDPEEDKNLYDTVIENIIHGPCGARNSASPCTKNGKCPKKYPREMIKETVHNDKGSPLYR